MVIYDFLKKRDGETDLQYHKRILYSKLVDKTIDLDYSTLAPYLYGKEFASDVARRMAYGSMRTLKLIENSNLYEMNSKEAIDEIENKIIELKKERQKFSDQRREYNKLISGEARREHIESELIRAASELPLSVGDLYAFKQNSGIRYDTEAILVFSDWHYGLKTSNVFNEYSMEICRRRVMSVVEKAIERIELHKCNRLHVVVLGDICHGAIHNSARVASEELVCDQIMQASEILAQSVEYLSGFVNETIVYMTYGNHARTVQNKNDSIHRDNMERLVPWWLSQRLSRNGSVKIAESEDNEFLFVNACGHEFCASHGDNDSVRSSPRLMGTLFRKKYGKDIEYILLGDKHHRESFDELGISAMLCGSLCGTDDYANDKRLYSTPSQMLLIVDKNIGVDAEYRIKCE